MSGVVRAELSTIVQNCPQMSGMFNNTGAKQRMSREDCWTLNSDDLEPSLTIRRGAARDGESVGD